MKRLAGSLVLAGLVLTGVGGGPAAGRAGAGDVPIPSPVNATVLTIGSVPQGSPIPSGFVGVSLEYKTIGGAEYASPRGLDTVLAQLIRNLAPGQTPIIRIGGDSTDWTWWPIRGVRRLPGLTYSLTPQWLARARALALSTGGRLILGVNLEANSTTIASVEARHLVDGIGRSHIEALEIGNEPELYSALPWFHTAAGVPGFGRPLTYNLTNYAQEFAAMARVMPPVPLAGPSTGSSAWIAGLGQLIAANPSLRIATFHAYALNPFGDAFRGHNCSTPRGDPAHPSVPALLASYASQGLFQDVSASVALAHSHGLRFRLDEMNAITCAGTRGVSNTSASALWVLDALFVLAHAGVDGVNVHTWRGSAGRLFDIRRRHHRWVGAVAPEYYGLLMFAQAAPPRSRLLPVAQSNPGQMHAWAVLAPDDSERVVLINDDLSHARWVVVRPPRAAGQARLERLLAPSAYARSGITLAGQSFGARTTTGLLTGRPRDSMVRAVGRTYVVRVPAASAALLAFRG
jgi:hypothetical protein